jgi:Mrp family chromosome partitioning ATPase
MERLFGLESGNGLVQVLRGEVALPEVTLRAVPRRIAEGSANGHGPASQNGDPRKGGSVDVLTHGERVDNPVGLLSSERMTMLLDEASRAYDVVLLDTSPVLTVADSVPLLEVVDSVLVVTRLGQTTRQSADRFTDLIERLSDVNFAGVIANDRREQFDDEGYGSYGRYGYGYYYRGKSSERKQKAGSAAS